MTARTLGQWERTVHHAEGVGRVAEVGEVAAEDGPVGLAQRRAELLDSAKSQVDVAEADEPHGPSCNYRAASLQRRTVRLSARTFGQCCLTA